MTKTTRARPDDGGTGGHLPGADLSVDHINQIRESLPKSLTAAIHRAECDARALGWLVLKLADDWKRSKDTLESLLWREASRVDNGGELLNEVAAEIGLRVTEEVLCGLHYAIKAHLDSLYHPDQPLEALRQHAADHVMEYGEPILLLDETSPCPHEARDGAPGAPVGADRVADDGDYDPQAADRRYSELLEELQNLAGWDLVSQLDEVVGQRLAEAQGDIRRQSFLDHIADLTIDARHKLATAAEMKRVVGIEEKRTHERDPRPV